MAGQEGGVKRDGEIQPLHVRHPPRGENQTVKCSPPHTATAMKQQLGKTGGVKRDGEPEHI